MTDNSTSRRHVSIPAVFLLVAAVLILAPRPAGAEVVVVLDDPGGVLGRTGSPASAEVSLTDAALVTAAKAGRLALIEPDVNAKRTVIIPAQFVADPAKPASGTLWWIMRPGPIGKRRFRLMAWLIPPPGLTVRHDKTAGNYTILAGKAPVLRYNFGTVPVPAGVKGKYAVARSNYVHPLYGPGGEVLTTDFSRDHPHHRGIYWAWPEVYYKGQKRDLHALQGVFARPVGMVPVVSGPVFARLQAENLWKWGDTEPIVRETAIIRAFAAGSGGRCIDFEFRFTALVDGVSIARRGQSHYGGFNMRCSSRQGQKIAYHTDAAGSTPRRSWGRIVGTPPKGTQPVSISIFQHAANPDYPGDWQPYPNINWLQPTFPAKGTKYALSKDKPLVLRYRLWVRSGPLADKTLADLWSAYNTVSPKADGKKARAATIDAVLTGPRKAGDTATIRHDGGATTIEITSEFGIGRAEIRRLGDRWPRRIVLRLKLKALEGFSATDGKEKFQHSVSRAPAGKPIDVTLPESLLRSASKTLRIQWIDFYR